MGLSGKLVRLRAMGVESDERNLGKYVKRGRDTSNYKPGLVTVNDEFAALLAIMMRRQVCTVSAKRHLTTKYGQFDCVVIETIVCGV